MRWSVCVLGVLAACGAETDRPGGFAYGTSGPYFSELMFFNAEVDGVDPARDSDALIAQLRDDGGWGNGDRIHIDFSFDVLRADVDTPRELFTPTDEFYEPDCDHMEVPVPPGGNLEGEDGYSCDNGGDCHLLVHDESASRLYEMWRADLGGDFRGGCLAVWESNRRYDEALRGDQCTSADAAGFPIAPLLFTADEVAAGEIAHAIRFILPNNRIGDGFVRPATHATHAVAGGGSRLPYGAHLRLRSDYPVAELPSEGARVVARALQKYGMYHADGGNIALTAQSDRYTTAKWDGLLKAQDLYSLKVEDFEVIDHGDRIALTLDCER